MKTIQYMGSKKNLLEFIDNCLQDYLKEHALYCLEDKDRSYCDPKIFFDVFSGSGRVSYYFRDKYQIVSNDKLSFSKVILDAYTCNPHPKESYIGLIQKLNHLEEKMFVHTDIDWWYSKTYGGDWNGGKSEDEQGVKKVWRLGNARKIDMIRYQIAFWKKEKTIDSAQESVLLLSLVLAINKVSNVVGHQNGYLKKWCENANRELILEVPDIFVTPKSIHRHHTGDIFTQIRILSGDIAYFDPPYGTNNKNLSVATRYSSFYHIWNTLVENSRPDVFGKARKPVSTKGYTEPLERNKKEVVFPKIVRLIEEVDAEYVLFSYSNKSLLTAKDFQKAYELAGCDMKTFCIYIVEHVSNNQTKLAKKEGDWIDRVNESTPLQEYLFIARKERSRRDDPNRITKGSLQDIESFPQTDSWLALPEDAQLPENVNIKWYPKDIQKESKKEVSIERPISLFDYLH